MSDHRGYNNGDSRSNSSQISEVDQQNLSLREQIDRQADIIYDKYRLNFEPEYRAKYRQQFPFVSLGLNFCFMTFPYEYQQMSVMVKPGYKRNKEKELYRKIELNTFKQISIESRKFKWKIFEGLLGFGYDFINKKPLFKCRFQLKFQRVNKLTVFNTKRLELKGVYQFQYQPPIYEQSHDGEKVLDIGSMQFDVKKVDIVLKNQGRFLEYNRNRQEQLRKERQARQSNFKKSTTKNNQDDIHITDSPMEQQIDDIINKKRQVGQKVQTKLITGKNNQILEKLMDVGETMKQKVTQFQVVFTDLVKDAQKRAQQNNPPK